MNMFSGDTFRALLQGRRILPSFSRAREGARTGHCMLPPYVDTVGRNKKQIQEYIKKQLEEDQIADQMSLKEYIDPFTGSKESKA